MATPIRTVHLISAASDGGADILVKDLVIASRRAGQEPLVLFASRAADLGLSVETEGAFLEELRREGVPYRFLRRGCRRNLPLGAMQVRRACREHRAQIYHSHLKIGILFGALLKIPRVHTHHSSIAKMPHWAYRMLNPLVEAHVSVSDACAESIRRFTGRPVVSIRSGVRPERIPAARRRPHRPSGEISCLAVGRLRPAKNYPLLVEAIARLSPEVRRKLRVSIAGEASPAAAAELISHIRSAGLGDVITLLGGRDDIPQLLGDADLFLMSSAWEGLPIALLEATMSGLPFIATDVGGCAEAAAVARNGIVVDPADADAFAAAVAALVSDREKLSNLSANALANRDAFNIEATVEGHNRLYRSLIGDLPADRAAS